jgi:hypothetical protein
MGAYGATRSSVALANGSSTAEEVDDDQYECDDEQKVDETATDVHGEAYQPEDEKYDDNGPE